MNKAQHFFSFLFCLFLITSNIVSYIPDCLLSLLSLDDLWSLLAQSFQALDKAEPISVETFFFQERKRPQN